MPVNERVTAQRSDQFGSLDAMKAEHRALLKKAKAEKDANLLAEEIKSFLEKGRNTGAILDDANERGSAQSLIDYWIATLYSLPKAPRAGPESIAPYDRQSAALLEFDEGTIRAAAEAANEWFAPLPPAEKKVVRGVLLRLVRLRPDEPSFDPVPVTRGALQYRGPSAEQVDEVIRQLIRLGVARQTRADSPMNDLITLRSPDLMQHWGALRGWLSERLNFRKEAKEWEDEVARASGRAGVAWTVDFIDQQVTRKLSKLGRWVNKKFVPAALWLRRRSGLATPSQKLVTGEELEKARAYHDCNPTEKRFSDESQYRQQLANDVNRVLLGMFTLLFIGATVSCIWAVSNLVGWEAAYREAEGLRKEADRLREEEKLINASWELQKGAGTLNDSSCAFLWYADAWRNFSSASKAGREDAQALEESYLLRLGAAQRELPFLAGMAYDLRLFPALSDRRFSPPTAWVCTLDGKAALTVGGDNEQDKKPLVMLWCWDGTPASGKWSPSILKWQQSPPPRASEILAASLSDTGGVAIVATKSGAVYVWGNPKDGSFPTQKLDGNGKLNDVAVSPDGRYAAVVTAPSEERATKGEQPTNQVILWAVGSDAPLAQGPRIKSHLNYW